MEEAIHVRFNDTKHDTKISKLDESFVDIRLDKGIGSLTEQTSETKTYRNKVVRDMRTNCSDIPVF